MDGRRLVVSFTLLAAATLSQPLAAGAADASTPPTLNGEMLLSTSQTVVANCNPDGTSIMSYLVVGKAGALDSRGNFSDKAGPYPGRYIEEGTLSMGPQTIFSYGANPATIQTWTATILIESKTGTVRLKTVLSAPSGGGFCFVNSNGMADQEAWGNSPAASYSYAATITTRRDGTFSDSGGSTPNLAAPNPYSSAPNQFFEFFASSQASTTLIQ